MNSVIVLVHNYSSTVFHSRFGRCPPPPLAPCVGGHQFRVTGVAACFLRVTPRSAQRPRFIMCIQLSLNLTSSANINCHCGSSRGDEVIVRFIQNFICRLMIRKYKSFGVLTSNFFSNRDGLADVSEANVHSTLFIFSYLTPCFELTNT